METMQPVLKRGRDFWDRNNMPKAEFQGRIKIIREAMVKRNIDILLIYGNGNNEYGNPCYLSNYEVHMPKEGALVVLPQKGNALLIPEATSRDLPFIKSTTWIEDIRPCGDVSKECVKYLKENNLMSSTIGLVGLRRLMPYYQWQFLEGSVRQCKIVDANYIIRDMRMLKSQRECDQIRHASRILTHAFEFISRTSFPNMSEINIQAIVDREVRLQGTEDFRMMVAKPLERKWAFRPAEDMEMLLGDTVIFYLAIEFERYWSEGIRTFKIEHKRLIPSEFKSAESLYKQIMGGMQSGIIISQFYKETVDKLKTNNIQYIEEYGLGQGIGLSLQESPLIDEEESSELKEGMCFSLHLAIRDKKLGVIVKGDTIHILKNGPEILTR